jgi:hypothetical protein
VLRAQDGPHLGRTPPNDTLVQLETLLAAREAAAAHGTAEEAAAAASAYAAVLDPELERQREAGLQSKAARMAREQGTEEERARESKRK